MDIEQRRLEFERDPRKSRDDKDRSTWERPQIFE
jgi:hypothetical protein